MGVAVKDNKGDLIAALCTTKDYITDLATAEAIATGKAADLTCRMGLAKVVLEGGMHWMLFNCSGMKGDGWDNMGKWCMRQNDNW